eukprot:CAMPEP_0119322792 /NCGR_PEP_ID=MMETSP1333-20130426/59204_1 /TAXON_ID=418940 /ORGANISM="Scyphosphaera apsteinii, Strain RCC1455" /LENGTH=340 /DNA_ID=CAMNT_0007330115 /DNA_START=107 /DNA_END=1129 /DNA_ORIENTATION=-
MCTAIDAEPVGGPIGALIDAMSSSKCGAINKQLNDATDKETVLEITSQTIQRMNAINLATSLHRLARIEKHKRAERESLLRDKRFELLMDAIISRAPDFSPRSVADILWSLATLKYWPPVAVRPVLTQVALHLGRASTAAFEPQHLTIVTWALGTLECKPVKLLERIEEQALNSVGLLNTQNCANLLWGFAKLKQPTTKLVPAVSDYLMSSGLIQQCKPVEVSDLAFACAVLGKPETSRLFLEDLSTLARRNSKLNDFSSRQIVMLIWAFARLNIMPPDGCLDEWRETIVRFGQQRPMLAADRNNLEVALNRLGEDKKLWFPERDQQSGAEPAAQSAASA